MLALCPNVEYISFGPVKWSGPRACAMFSKLAGSLDQARRSSSIMDAKGWARLNPQCPLSSLRRLCLSEEPAEMTAILHAAGVLPVLEIIHCGSTMEYDQLHLPVDLFLAPTRSLQTCVDPCTDIVDMSLPCKPLRHLPPLEDYRRVANALHMEVNAILQDLGHHSIDSLSSFELDCERHQNYFKLEPGLLKNFTKNFTVLVSVDIALNHLIHSTESGLFRVQRLADFLSATVKVLHISIAEVEEDIDFFRRRFEPGEDVVVRRINFVDAVKDAFRGLPAMKNSCLPRLNRLVIRPGLARQDGEFTYANLKTFTHVRRVIQDMQTECILRNAIGEDANWPDHSNSTRNDIEMTRE